MTTERFDEADLYYRVPDPAEESIDALDCGSSLAGIEEARWFKLRGWTGAVDGRECTCLQLLTLTGEVIGYIAFQVVEKTHPSRRSKAKADYLFLYHLCLQTSYQGRKDASVSPPTKFSALTLRLVDTLATSFECVGVYLNVRLDNAPARKLYKDVGFAEDGNYKRASDDVDMLRMRKTLRS